MFWVSCTFVYFSMCMFWGLCTFAFAALQDQNYGELYTFECTPVTLRLCSVSVLHLTWNWLSRPCGPKQRSAHKEHKAHQVASASPKITYEWNWMSFPRLTGELARTAVVGSWRGHGRGKVCNSGRSLMHRWGMSLKPVQLLHLLTLQSPSPRASCRSTQLYFLALYKSLFILLWKFFCYKSF